MERSRGISDSKARDHVRFTCETTEEHYRLLAENSKDVIYLFSLADGSYQYMSPASTEVYGYSPDEFYNTPQLTRKIMHPDSLSYYDEHYSRLLSGDIPSSYEYKIIHRSGEARWMHQRNVLIRDNGGAPIAVEGVVTDITERKLMEEELRKHRDHLESLVNARTAELTEANRLLEERAVKLEEMNTALRVLLEKREKDKAELEEKVLLSVNEMVRPYLKKLENSGLASTQQAYLDILRSNIEDIVSPLPLRLSAKHLNLTPTEMKVANLVKQGKATKEIAELLHLSSGTVEFHRANIRNKLGIKNQKVNLRTYLASMQ